MEVVLPCLIGLLCFCALWMGTGAVLERGAGSLQGDAIGDRMALVETLRTLWPVEKLIGTRAVRAAADALAIVAYRGRRPFEHITLADRGILVLVASCASGALGIVISSSVLGSALSLLPAVSLCAIGRSHARGRARELETAMPEAFGSLAISLGTGYSLPQAMRFVGARSREPVRSEFMRVSFAVDCGESAPQALDAMLGRLRAPGLELVVLALKVSQRTGAPLGELLSEAADLCRERLELKRALDVKTSQARMSARMVAVMPVAMIGLLALLSSDFRSGLVTPVGAVSIAVALVLNALAWMVIGKIMDIEV